MPQLPSRRSPAASRHPSLLRPSSLLGLLFPQARTRARRQLAHLRYNTLPALRQRAQSRIYQYIVYRQSLKLRATRQGHLSLFQRVRRHTRTLTGSGGLENASRAQRQHLAQRIPSQARETPEMQYTESYQAREPGTRRKKLASYLRAANDIRQSYTQQYTSAWTTKDAHYEYGDDGVAALSDVAVACSGDEEMILFPSYARKHVKRQPEAQPSTTQEEAGEGRDVEDVRESSGAGDAEFWKQQWNNYEDDCAVVDVDVRGWIYSPQKGQMSRKQRLFVGLARQLVGVQAPSETSASSVSSQDTIPVSQGFRERSHLRDAQRDDAIAAREAEQILRKGEQESQVAATGAYSEKPVHNMGDTQVYRAESSSDMRTSNPQFPQLAHSTSNNSIRSEGSLQPSQERGSWNQPSKMSPVELAEANARLMARLRHFLAIPMANSPISVFFYNDQISKQRTVYTDASGHFNMSAALDFVPTHVRILASDKLSAEEKVIITGEQGISVISDIDDTIKHSAISSGAREIFRNVFIRDLLDLTIEGVREWYNRMADLGVKFHYVSNSPWQLYPVISKYFSLAGLPPGSFHLKQYSGMLQGIFEPVAERKKVTLDKIARDFPERHFILVGDSGEADLEVYTDFVIENPGRVVAVFIRDVTTTSDSPGFFTPSIGGNQPSSALSGNQVGGVANNPSKARSASEEHDPELKAAIAASLRDMHDENMKRSTLESQREFEDHPDCRPPLPDRNSSHSTLSRNHASLIDLSPDDEQEVPSAVRRVYTEGMSESSKRHTSGSTTSLKSPPPLPRKPVALRAVSSESTPGSTAPLIQRPTPPPPRKPSSISQPRPLAQKPSFSDTSNATNSIVASNPRPIHESQSQEQQSYGGMAREKLWSVYNALPALRPTEDSPNPSSSTLDVEHGKKAPPPPPARRVNHESAAGAASYVGSKASAAWQYAPSIPYHSRPLTNTAQTPQPFSSPVSRQGVNRTSNGSAIGSVGSEPYGTKREQLWRQRWAKAEQVLGEQNVVLRSWRVGSDVVGESEKIITEAAKKWERQT